MKKTIYTLLCICCLTIQAQVRNYTKKSSTPTKIKKSKIKDESDRKIGVTLGYLLSNESGSADDFPSTTVRKSIYGGITYNFLKKDGFKLEAQLLYANMGAVFNDKYLDKLDYIQLPIFFQPEWGAFVLRLGPQIGYLIKGEYRGVDYSKDLNKIDYGMAGMIGFTIKNDLEISLRYYLGLANTYNNTDFGTVKNNAIGIGASYKFY